MLVMYVCTKGLYVLQRHSPCNKYYVIDLVNILDIRTGNNN